MKISVVIPVYNVERHIECCLKSLQNQTLSDFEAIFVDDASPDGSMNIVQAYAQCDARIRVLQHAKNRGLMMTRRTGYQAAQGDYIVFCDSDDNLPSDALENLYHTIENAGADMAVASYTLVSDAGTQLLKKQHAVSMEHYPVDVYKALLHDEIPHSLWAKIYKRSLFADYAYDTQENHTNAEDAMLLYQVVQHVQKVAIVDANTYNYVCNMASTTHVRLSDRQVKQIVAMWNFRYNLLAAWPELLPFMRHRYRRDLYDLLICDYDKQFILRQSQLPASITDLSWQAISETLTGWQRLDYYLVFHSRMFRKIRPLLAHWKSNFI